MAGTEGFAVVIPAYNEEAVIATTIASLRAGPSRHVAADKLKVIVVDDGPDDDTVRVTEAAGAVTIRHPTNRGKGAAVQTGFLATRIRHVVFTDADLAYSPRRCLRSSTASRLALTSS